MINNNFKKKISGLVITLILIILIFSILIPTSTAVLITPGTPDDTSVNKGNTITFEDVNLTIRGLERIPVNNLTFTIYNSANDNTVAYVKFYISGEEILDYPTGKFTVSNTTIIGDNWYGYGYQNGSDETLSNEHSFGYGYGYGYGGDSGYTDITFLYDIIYTTHTTGTFYAKLSLNSTSHTFTSANSTAFTVSQTSSSGGGTTPPTPEEEPTTDEILIIIEEEFNINLTESFYANDTNGDGILDSFTDPNNILTLVNITIINEHTCFLISIDGDLIPEFFWDPIDNTITSITYNLGIIKDIVINKLDKNIIITISIDKANWTYIEINDPYPTATNLTIFTSNGRTINTDMIWRENNKIKILDDPTLEYYILYNYIANDIIIDLNLNLDKNLVKNTENINALIKITNNEILKLINGTITYELSKDSTIIKTEEEKLLLKNEHTINKIINTTLLQPGEYAYKTTYNYGDGLTITASERFIIESTTGVPWIIIIAFLIFAIIISTLIFLFKTGYLELVNDEEK